MRFGWNRLFRNLEFYLEGGESLAITGPNGSGKSTLIRIVAGVLAADEGEIKLHDGSSEIPKQDRSLHAGMVAPYLNVYEGLSARENLEFLARARLHKEAATRIGELLEFVGLGKRGDDLVSTFSSGMKQRVKYAAALLSQPVLLLLDEPGSNLDSAGLRMLDRVIERWRAEGRLVVVATNDQAEADRCDRRISLADFQ